MLLVFPSVSFTQNTGSSSDKKAYLHHEIPDDAYLPVPPGNAKTSPAYKYNGTGIITVQVNVNANGENILGDAANEPSIAIDPNDSNKIVIGWRQFNTISSNFRQAGYGYSTDAGQTWTFPGVIEPGIFRSDPVLDCDNSGNFYYNSLTSDYNGYFCKVFKSTSGGAGWNTGADAWGGDKQWMTIDKSGGIGTGNIYSFWTYFYSSCAEAFTRSTDGGTSFEECSYMAGDPYWGTMAVDAEGDLYVAGAAGIDGVVVAKSTNAQIPGSIVDWDFSTMVFMDGYLNVQTPINPVGLLGQTYVDVDRSNGPGRGNVYVLASVVRFSNSDPGDIMFARSTDGGLTWSAPIRINDDPESFHYQWFGTMSVAPNGRIDAIWLDTRNDPDDLFKSALYYSYSNDYGETWSNNEKLSGIFDPQVGYPQQDKMGDYFDMVSDDIGAHLAWANTFNEEEDVYYSRIIPDITGIEHLQGKQDQLSLTCYPNPFKGQATIRYRTPGNCFVRVVICNLYGEEIRTLVEKEQPAGTNTLNFGDGSIPAGYYLCKLEAGNKMKTTRLIKLK